MRSHVLRVANARNDSNKNERNPTEEEQETLIPTHEKTKQDDDDDDGQQMKWNCLCLSV